MVVNLYIWKKNEKPLLSMRRKKSIFSVIIQPKGLTTFWNTSL